MSYELNKEKLISFQEQGWHQEALWLRRINIHILFDFFIGPRFALNLPMFINKCS
jgi:hypothetical protein